MTLDPAAAHNLAQTYSVTPATPVGDRPHEHPDQADWDVGPCWACGADAGTACYPNCDIAWP